MVLMLVFLVCFLASTIGAICGIGGGVIIKPVLDAFGIMSVSKISFLSSCTVLSMTTYSVVKSKLGGILGKLMFEQIRNASSNPDRVGMIQSACLFC